MNLSDGLDVLQRRNVITAYQRSVMEHELKPVWAMPLAARDILDRICAAHNVAIRDMLGPSRLSHLIKARHEAYAAIRDLGWSFPRIGRLMHRDHSTIIYGVRAHRERVGQ